jgi:branched-chain amino acid transport system substrate-binding protein
MENFIGVWWSGSEGDVLPAGEAAHGYKALAMHNTGADFPIYADLKKYVFDAGKAAGDGSSAGTVLYNRGIYAAMLATEAARQAQSMTGKQIITPSDMRDAMEQFSIDEARMTAIGLPNFAPSFSVSCENHGGPGLAAIQQWDAKAQKWSLISDFIKTDSEVIGSLIAEDSAAYAKENKIAPQCS